MKKTRQIERRRLIATMVAAGVVPWHRLLADDKLLPVTPSDAEGPFYPVEIPSDSDNDLLRVVGKKDSSPGQLAYVHGTVVDRKGTPVDGARVEIWQCDANGRYRHPRDRRRVPVDANFQGFGHTVTDESGRYRFRTIRPVPYPGRTPHIHAAVFRPGHAYCHRCKGAMCEHSEPPSSRHVFVGYAPTGAPRWTDFAQWCLDRYLEIVGAPGHCRRDGQTTDHSD